VVAVSLRRRGACVSHPLLTSGVLERSRRAEIGLADGVSVCSRICRRRRRPTQPASGQQHVRQTRERRAAVPVVLEEDLKLPQPLLHPSAGQLRVPCVCAHVCSAGPNEAARALGARARVGVQAGRAQASCLPLIRLCFRVRRPPPRLRLGLH